MHINNLCYVNISNTKSLAFQRQFFFSPYSNCIYTGHKLILKIYAVVSFCLLYISAGNSSVSWNLRNNFFCSNSVGIFILALIASVGITSEAAAFPSFRSYICFQLLYMVSYLISNSKCHFLFKNQGQHHIPSTSNGMKSFFI